MTQVNQLSEREKEVVQHLLQGKSNKLIARSLGISGRTVEFHLKNVYAKFQVSSRIELILKLGNTPGNNLTENLGSSTVDSLKESAENRASPNSQMDWAQSFRETVSITGQESEMKKRWTFYISNGILWAAAIIASAIVGAPTILSVALLPALAVACLLVTGPKLATPEGQA